MFPNIPKPNGSSIAFPGFPIPSKAIQAFPGFPSIGKAQDLFNYLEGWNQSQIYEITIDSSLVDEDLENFPVLLKLWSGCFEAKSIIIDIADAWGDSDYVNIRSVDFMLDGSKITLLKNIDFYSYATSTHSSFDSDDAFDTSVSKIGSSAGASWNCGYGSGPNNKRLIIVFNAPQTFDSIIINNCHQSGGTLTRGAKNVKIHMSTDVITSTVYDAAIANSTLLFDDVFDQHSAVNEEDPQTLSLTSLSSVVVPELFSTIFPIILDPITAKSFIIDIADNFDSTDYCDIRQIDFWYQGSKIDVLTADITTYHTTEHSSGAYGSELAFDTTTAKDGARSDNSWLSAFNQALDNRLICVFDTTITFDQIIINNGHTSGTKTEYGAQNVKLYVSSDTITSTVYGEAISNSTLIYDGVFRRHQDITNEDPEILCDLGNIVDVTIDFPDKIAIVGDGVNQLSVEVQEVDLEIGLLVMWTKIPLVKANQDTKLYLYYDDTKPDAVSVTAKSVIFDIADNWGGSYIGFRSVEFYDNDGVLIALTTSDFTAYSTGIYSTFDAEHAFDTALLKTGTSSSTSWVDNGSTNRRLICVFDEVQTISKIVINNHHNSGAGESSGGKTTTIQSSTDAITNTTYGTAIANSTVLSESAVIVEHVASDIEHSQVVYKFNPTDEQTGATLLISSNDTDGDTVFHDTSFNGHSITTVADTHHEDTEKKFGDTSIYFDGTGDYLSIPDSDDWDMDSGDFTLDFWIKRGRTTTREYVCGQIDVSGGTAKTNLQIQIRSTDVVSIQQGYAATYFSWDTSASISDTNWHHVTLSRNTNDLNIFIDGILEDTRDVTGYSFTNQSDTFSIGRSGAFTSYYFQGYIDEFRIVKGTAVWTEDFTPPVAPYAEVVPYNGVQNSPAGMQVWDDNFKAVYHMNQDPNGDVTDCILDSTQNVNHGTPGGTMLTEDLVDGIIDKAIDFDGVDDYIESKFNVGISGDAARTMEVITKQEDVSSTFLEIGGASSGQAFGLYVESALSAGFRIRCINGNLVWPEDLSIEEKYLAIIFPDGGGNIDDTLAYSDAVLLTETSHSSYTLNTTDSHLFIGRDTTSSTDADGTIEEVRISDVARSAAWIKATYNSLFNTLLTIAKKV